MRTVRRDPLLVICERCSTTFNGTSEEILKAFASHTCKPKDSSQNALRIVREATEGK
jgi:hypothetical protein